MEKFDGTSRFLHWLSALVILWASFSGLYAATLDNNSELKHQIGFFNVSITTLLIPFFVWRLLNSWLRTTPPKPSELPQWNKSIARMTHHIMYATTAIVLISGILMMTREICVFSIFTFENPIKAPFITHLFEVIHSISSKVLAGIIILHIAAVVKHQISGVPILKRMI